VSVNPNNDANAPPKSPPPPSVLVDETTLQDAGSQCFADEEDFQEVIHINPEQLKTADHDDVKLRKPLASFQMSGGHPEAGVVASPSAMVTSSVVAHLHEPAILNALRL
jgi:hypothetical protein